jgi:putative inorganic carbon (HCO3(-)) transporter
MTSAVPATQEPMHAGAARTRWFEVQQRVAPWLPWGFLAGAALGALALGMLAPAHGLLLAAGLAGGSLGLIAFLRPEIGLFLFTLMLYSRASENFTLVFGVPSIAPPFAVMMLTGLVIRQGLGDLFRTRLAYWTPPLLYGLVVLATVFVAIDKSVVIDAAINLSRELMFIVVVVLYARTIRDTRIIVRALILAGVIPALLTIYQTMSGSEFTFFGFGQYSAQIVVPGETEQVSRPAGHVGDPNFFALALVPLIPLALHRARYESSLFLRQVAVVAAGILGTAVVLTYSRGAYLALAFMFVAAVLAGFVRWRTLLIAAAIFVILVPILPQSYTGRLTSLVELGIAVVRADDGAPSVTERDTSVSGRRSQLFAGARMFLEHPILGVGVHNAALHYQEYARDVGIHQRTNRSLHSLYLETAAETGMAGLAAFGLLIGALVVWLRRVWTSVRQSPELRDLAHAFAVALIGFLVCSLFLHGSYPRFMWMLIAGIIATCVVADERRKLRPHYRFEPIRSISTRAAGTEGHRSRLYGTAAALLLAFVVSVGVADAALRRDGVVLLPLPDAAPASRPQDAGPGTSILVPGRAATPTPAPGATPTVRLPGGESTPPAVATPTATTQPVADAARLAAIERARLPALEDADCDYFNVTQHNLCWPFSSYWERNGGLPIFGYPLTEPFDDAGVTVQYFERVRLEWHVGNDGRTSRIVQAPLGREALRAALGVDVMPPALPGDDLLCLFEDETQQNVCGQFLWFWLSNGSVTRLGLPLSEELMVNDTIVQYFEFARLERPAGDDVQGGGIMLGRLGAEDLDRVLADGTGE